MNVMNGRVGCGCTVVTNTGWNSIEPVVKTVLCDIHRNENRSAKLDEYAEKLRSKI